MRRTGYNILGEFLNPPSGDIRPALLSHLSAYRPAAITVMDNSGFAVEAWEATGGETMVIHRHYHPREGYLFTEMSAEDYAHYITYGRTLDKRLWPQVWNEPTTESNRLPLLVRMTIEVADILTSWGYRAVLGNIGTATIQPGTVASGVFDPLLLRAATWEHCLAYHEYTAILAPFGVGYWSVDELRNPQTVQPLNTQPKVLIICNGAPSVVAAQYWGVPAIAQEGGEHGLSETNLAELQTKWQGAIYICLEDDEAGNLAAEKLLKQLPAAKRIPLNLTGSQDLADFCKLYGKDSLSELQHRAQVAPTDDVSQSIQELAKQSRIEVAEVRAGKVVKLGLLSHISDLDNAIGSFRPHRIHTILGATGMGKSTLACSIGMALLFQAPGLFVPTETPPPLWFNKMLAYASKVPVDKIIEGTYTEAEAKRILPIQDRNIYRHSQ